MKGERKMAFVTTKEMLKEAQKGRYGIGAFNANNMEIIQAIIEAAEEEKAPVILQASQGAIKYAGLDMIVAIVKVMAEKATVPVALHLDHGTDYYQNIKCLRAGFTSLMYDGSKLPFDENVEMTKKVVEMAHVCDIPVEAESKREYGCSGRSCKICRVDRNWFSCRCRGNNSWMSYSFCKIRYPSYRKNKGVNRSSFGFTWRLRC